MQPKVAQMRRVCSFCVEGFGCVIQGLDMLHVRLLACFCEPCDHYLIFKSRPLGMWTVTQHDYHIFIYVNKSKLYL